MTERTITARVFRMDPSVDEEPRYQEYRVPFEEGMSAMDVLDYIYQNLDGTLAYIESRPGYAVSIGLVARDGTPLIGVVYDPVSDVLYSALQGQGVKRQGQPWAPLSTPQAGRPFTVEQAWVQPPQCRNSRKCCRTKAIPGGILPWREGRAPTP